MAKNWLTKHGFEWAEVRIDMNPEAREFLINEGHRTMPQIYHNGKLLVEGGGQALVRMDPKKVKELIGEVIDVGDIQL
jgi:glutaredoxin|tara:strand:+ start:777 stop:1010 length:234 start_codon:yes stop_codon:yes gene_type:complete